MRRLALATVVALFIAHLVVVEASADGDVPSFRRTTPRGSFGRDGLELVVGVPGGRAWGIESQLLPVPAGPALIRATVEVKDPKVREAFVRVAWYDRTTGRPKQIALTDARAVRAGQTATLEVMLDPPPRAVAYRLRVLARLGSRDEHSGEDAVRATLSGPFPRARPIPATQLLP